MASPAKTTDKKRSNRDERLARQRRRNTLRKLRVMKKDGAIDLFKVEA